MNRRTRRQIRAQADVLAEVTTKLAEISEEEARPVAIRCGPRYWLACHLLDKTVLDLVEATKRLREIR